jgi:hypothetical protein
MQEQRVNRGDDMGALSILHWIIVILVLVLYGVPAAKILGSAGYNKWWTIAFFDPLLNIIALWVFAFSRWPVLDRPSS